MLTEKSCYRDTGSTEKSLAESRDVTEERKAEGNTAGSCAEGKDVTEERKAERYTAGSCERAETWQRDEKEYRTRERERRQEEGALSF